MEEISAFTINFGNDLGQRRCGVVHWEWFVVRELSVTGPSFFCWCAQEFEDPFDLIIHVAPGK